MKELTPQRLRDLLDYDPQVGVFTWRVARRYKTPIGKKAGCLSDGKVSIRIDGCDYLAHRLVFLHQEGKWPAEIVRAHNGNLADLRRTNLQQCTWQDRQLEIEDALENNRLGIRGVSRSDTKNPRFTARVQDGKRTRRIGSFGTPQEAAFAYWFAKALLLLAQSAPD